MRARARGPLMPPESGIMVDMNGDNGPRRLERTFKGRLLAGVCSGVGILGLDPTLIRVIFGVLALAGGVGIVIYLVAWALVPEEGEPASIAEKIVNKSGSA